MRLAVTTLDGVVHDANILPIDEVQFERKSGTSLAALGENPRVEQLLDLAHFALVRQGDADPDFDTWLATLASYGVEDDVPLEQSNSSSAPSPSEPA